MIEPEHPQLPIVRQCELLGVARASYYHRPEPESDATLRLMRVIDETYLAHPEFGSRQMARWLRMQVWFMLTDMAANRPPRNAARNYMRTSNVCSNQPTRATVITKSVLAT